MFINLSNHPALLWSDEQKKAAYKYGKIKDIDFPNILPECTEQDIVELARKYSENIIAMNPKCVMCQGEFSFVYRVVNNLKKAGIKAVAACSERNVTDIKNGDGTSSKITTFIFVKFREYI